MYDSANTIDYAGELSKLRQEGGNYEDYQNEFMSHVQGLFQEYLLSCFLSNMRDF